MPILKSAKKSLRQSRKNQTRNYQNRSKLKTSIKEMEKIVKKGDVKEAKDKLTSVYKVIDIAAKKNIIQKNTASRRKSKLARMINSMEKKAK